MTRQQQEVKASRTGLGRHIDVLLTPDQVGVGKPEIRTSGLACGRLGVPLHAVVDVGDQLEADALAASAVGLRGGWLNRQGGAIAPGVERVERVDDPAGLPSLPGATRLI